MVKSFIWTLLLSSCVSMHNLRPAQPVAPGNWAFSAALNFYSLRSISHLSLADEQLLDLVIPSLGFGGRYGLGEGYDLGLDLFLPSIVRMDSHVHLWSTSYNYFATGLGVSYGQLSLAEETWRFAEFFLPFYHTYDLGDWGLHNSLRVVRHIDRVRGGGSTSTEQEWQLGLSVGCNFHYFFFEFALLTDFFRSHYTRSIGLGLLF